MQLGIAFVLMNYNYPVELQQISEISGYPFQIHYPDTGFELFKIVFQAALKYILLIFMLTNIV